MNEEKTVWSEVRPTAETSRIASDIARKEGYLLAGFAEPPDVWSRNLDAAGVQPHRMVFLGAQNRIDAEDPSPVPWGVPLTETDVITAPYSAYLALAGKGDMFTLSPASFAAVCLEHGWAPLFTMRDGYLPHYGTFCIAPNLPNRETILDLTPAMRQWLVTHPAIEVVAWKDRRPRMALGPILLLDEFPRVVDDLTLEQHRFIAARAAGAIGLAPSPPPVSSSWVDPTASLILGPGIQRVPEVVYDEFGLFCGSVFLQGMSPVPAPRLVIGEDGMAYEVHGPNYEVMRWMNERKGWFAERAIADYILTPFVPNEYLPIYFYVVKGGGKEEDMFLRITGSNTLPPLPSSDSSVQRGQCIVLGPSNWRVPSARSAKGHVQFIALRHVPRTANGRIIRQGRAAAESREINAKLSSMVDLIRKSNPGSKVLELSKPLSEVTIRSNSITYIFTAVDVSPDYDYVRGRAYAGTHLTYPDLVEMISVVGAYVGSGEPLTPPGPNVIITDTPVPGIRPFQRVGAQSYYRADSASLNAIYGAKS